MVYVTRYVGRWFGLFTALTNNDTLLIASSFADIFWTFTGSPYNTIFKLIFLSSSAYTCYLMLNEYKPTHDPNLDTFKVQYLLGGSAILALIFPEVYVTSEVRRDPRWSSSWR